MATGVNPHFASLLIREAGRSLVAKPGQPSRQKLAGSRALSRLQQEALDVRKRLRELAAAGATAGPRGECDGDIAEVVDVWTGRALEILRDAAAGIADVDEKAR